MSNIEMVVLDVFLRNTNKKGESYASAHRVWDKETFLAQRAREARKEGGRADHITEEQYLLERKA